jgi:hypothetical protein
MQLVPPPKNFPFEQLVAIITRAIEAVNIYEFHLIYSTTQIDSVSAGSDACG